MSTMTERRQYEANETKYMREELRKMGYKCHHTASAFGYFETGRVELNDYKGKYGAGYKLEYHRIGLGGSYHFIEYWIKDEITKPSYTDKITKI